MTKRRLLPLLLLPTLSIPSACDEGPDAIDEFGLDADFRGADPSAMGPLPTCEAAANYDGISGQVYFPSFTSCVTTLPDLPLVVLLHGNTYAYTQYDFMLEHLASWGYIAVSIAVMAEGPDLHESATLAAVDYLDGFYAGWPMAGNIDPTRVALVGHSRGGGTVRHLAAALSGGTDPWTVKAVVVMAGTNADELDVMANTTEALLVMHGGTDADVPAYKGIRLADRSGIEGSTAPGSANGMHEAFKLFEGGYHSGFAGEQPIGSPDQATVARGYVLAFLRGHLSDNMSFYDDYIVGDAVPHGWPNRVLPQYSDVVRKVVDNFEDGVLAGNTIGGSVLLSNAQANVVDLEADPDSTHSTHAIDFRGLGKASSVTWTIPAGRGDVQTYADLSFRLAVDAGTPISGLYVSILNDGVWSPARAVSDYGEIPTPVPVTPYAAPPDRVMSTVRVPLVDLGPVNNVEQIRFMVSSTAINRWFLLDSLEFAGTAP